MTCYYLLLPLLLLLFLLLFLLLLQLHDFLVMPSTFSVMVGFSA